MPTYFMENNTDWTYRMQFALRTNWLKDRCLNVPFVWRWRLETYSTKLHVIHVICNSAFVKDCVLLITSHVYFYAGLCSSSSLFLKFWTWRSMRVVLGYLWNKIPLHYLTTLIASHYSLLLYIENSGACPKHGLPQLRLEISSNKTKLRVFW